MHSPELVDSVLAILSFLSVRGGGDRGGHVYGGFVDVGSGELSGNGKEGVHSRSLSSTGTDA